MIHLRCPICKKHYHIDHLRAFIRHCTAHFQTNAFPGYSPPTMDMIKDQIVAHGFKLFCPIPNIPRAAHRTMGLTWDTYLRPRDLPDVAIPPPHAGTSHESEDLTPNRPSLPQTLHVRRRLRMVENGERYVREDFFTFLSLSNFFNNCSDSEDENKPSCTDSHR